MDGDKEQVTGEPNNTMPAAPESPAATVSTPAPFAPKAQDWPQQVDDEPIWEKRTWSGLDQYRCKWRTKHLGGGSDEGYALPCNLDFFSYDALMAHIRDSH